MAQVKRSLRFSDDIRNLLTEIILFDAFGDLAEALKENIIRLGWQLYFEQVDSKLYDFFWDNYDELSQLIPQYDITTRQFKLNWMPPILELDINRIMLGTHVAFNGEHQEIRSSTCMWKWPMALPFNAIPNCKTIRNNVGTKTILLEPPTKRKTKALADVIVKDHRILSSRYTEIGLKLKLAFAHCNTSKQFIDNNPEYADFMDNAMKRYDAWRSPRLRELFLENLSRDGYKSVSRQTLAKVLPDTKAIHKALNR